MDKVIWAMLLGVELLGSHLFLVSHPQAKLQIHFFGNPTPRATFQVLSSHTWLWHHF